MPFRIPTILERKTIKYNELLIKPNIKIEENPDVDYIKWKTFGTFETFVIKNNGIFIESPLVSTTQIPFMNYESFKKVLFEPQENSPKFSHSGMCFYYVHITKQFKNKFSLIEKMTEFINQYEKERLKHFKKLKRKILMNMSGPYL